MPKQPDLLIEQRREEILDAFLSLYENTNLNEINIKMVGEATRFTRATIYNYFKNIDEMFICAYQKEYLAWAKALEKILEENETMTEEEFAVAIAHSLEERVRMLRLATANFHEREVNCRMEFVVQHKMAFREVLNRFHDCIAKFFPRIEEEDILRRVLIFFPFLHGMYRYVDLSDIQQEAMEIVGLSIRGSTIYDLAFQGTLQCLKQGRRR